MEHGRLKLANLGHLLPLYQPKNPKNQNFEKMKNARDIILQMCAGFEFRISRSRSVSYFSIIVMPEKSHFTILAIKNQGSTNLVFACTDFHALKIICA